MKTAALFLAIFSALFLTSCQKEKLPKPTQTGKNTFGCKINGKNWVPHGGGGFSGITPINATYRFPNDLLILASGYTGDKRTDVNIYIRNLVKTGKYSLDFNTGIYPDYPHPYSHGYYSIYGDVNGIIMPISYYTTSNYTGIVNIIRADTLNKIFSGTFEFTTVNEESGKTVRITDGRFDISLP